MNAVDLYVGERRLDLFKDEDISISLNVQNINQLDKVFTDFTQTFTVPATARNNELLGQYYNADIDVARVIITSPTGVSPLEAAVTAYDARVEADGGTVEGCLRAELAALGVSDAIPTRTTTETAPDWRLRPDARIEVNQMPFREGVFQMENVQMQNGEPYAYALSFFGHLVNLTDLFGDDYLYDLDLSAQDHTYDSATILSGFNQDSLGDVFYPLMSPKTNWHYNSSHTDHSSTDIAHHSGGGGNTYGVDFYELKPALKVLTIIDAIAAKYGVTFSGDFLTQAPIEKLYLWLHRYEGWMYQGQEGTAPWALVNFNSATGSFDTATDSWTVSAAEAGLTEFAYSVDNIAGSLSYQVAIFVNGKEESVSQHNGNVTGSLASPQADLRLYTGDVVQLYIKSTLGGGFNYRVFDFEAQLFGGSSAHFNADQTLFATYSQIVDISALMPEMKVTDFLSTLVKMHNLVVTPITATSFNLQSLDDWYDDGTSQTESLDITEYTINRPPLYRRLNFKYQDTEQILGKQYRELFGQGFGDLKADFDFSGEDFTIEVGAECPLFERLSDLADDSLTNVLVYKSITSEANEDGTYNPYLGAPIFVYAEFSIDISANTIAFFDDSGGHEEIDTIWYTNTSSSQSVGASKTLAFGASIDPFHLQSINASLYQEYWQDYITDLYDKSRRMVQVKAILPVGHLIKLQLNDSVIWGNDKYTINTADVNVTTGEVTFELLNQV